MIRIYKVGKNCIEVSWQTGKEYVFLKHLEKIIKDRNELKGD